MFKNTGYYIKESTILFSIDARANLLSILSMGLILTILGLVLTGIYSGNYFIDVISKEADVAVFYYDAIITAEDANELKSKIENINGVIEVQSISKEESIKEMEDVLGGDREVLELLDDNPFLPYLNVVAELENRSDIINSIESLSGVSHIRDNNDVVEKLKTLIGSLKTAGLFLIVSVSSVSIIVISHIIRQGVYLNRERIEILKLLGAPNGFIRIPFVIEGLFMSLASGVLATIILLGGVWLFYNKNTSVSFIPLPDRNSLLIINSVIILFFSAFLGVLGSVSGVVSIRKKS